MTQQLPRLVVALLCHTPPYCSIMNKIALDYLNNTLPYCHQRFCRSNHLTRACSYVMYSCPTYTNIPPTCRMVSIETECCPVLQCPSGTFITSTNNYYAIGNGGNIYTGGTYIQPTLTSGAVAQPGTGGSMFQAPAISEWNVCHDHSGHGHGRNTKAFGCCLRNVCVLSPCVSVFQFFVYVALSATARRAA